MAIYNVWLINLTGQMTNADAVPSEDARQAIKFGIQNGFIPIVQKVKPPFDGVNVQWIVCPITQLIQPYELLVYFVPAPIDTILDKIQNALGVRDSGGLTVFIHNGEHASEVYANVGDSDLVARVAFHEIMHNKLKLGNTMHNLHIGGGGIANASTGVNDNLTQKNINLMAAHLRDRHPQWTGGCVTNVDPLRGIL
jgi:hypothetical protein